LSHNGFYTGDDCLYISSEKVSTLGDGREVAKLTPEYRKVMNKGEIYSICYETIDRQKVFTSIDKVPDNRLHTVVECYGYNQNLDNGNRINIKGNKCQVRLLSLLNKPKENRYRLIVDALIELVRKGILQYSPRVKTLTLRHIREALRNRGLRDWKVEKYEYNIFFEGDIGRQIFECLKDDSRIPMNDKRENTIYLRTDKQIEANRQRREQGRAVISATVKYYYMLPKHGINAYKLEMTIDRDMIKKCKTDNLSLISTWLDQPSIQEIKPIHKRLKSGINLLLSHMNDEVMRGIKDMTGKENVKDIPDEILDSYHTLKEVLERVEGLEKDNKQIKETNKQIKETQERILEHIGLDKQEQSKD
jgi:hypothetical protein